MPGLNSEIGKNVTASIISAIILSLLLTVWNDFLYRKDRLTGYWQVEMTTVGAEDVNQVNTTQTYHFLINQEGTSLVGAAETEPAQGSENNEQGTIYYTLSGGLSFHFFSKNKVDILLEESNGPHPSSTVLLLDIESSGQLSGRFFSSAGRIHGTVKLTRVEDRHK